MNSPLNQVYQEHHAKRRGHFFLVYGKERGEFLNRAIGTGKRVLDIGCRDGALTAFYAEGNDVTGMDIDSAALARAEETLHIKTVHADLNGDWPVHGPYDIVVACEIIEHVYYPDTVLKKIGAVLKDSGVLLGSIPHAFSLQCRLRLLCARKRGTPLQDPTHSNHFSYKEFRRYLENAGFEDISITGLVSRKFSFLTPLFPYLFAHSFIFSATKR